MTDQNEKYQSAERVVEHVLEDVLDIELGTTVVPYEERVPTELVEHETYDEKDAEIEEQIQEVYDLALEAYQNSTESIPGMDPKYRARNEEVASTYLTLALTAARDKSNMKQNKDRLEKMASKSNGTTNNLIIDRETLLKMMDDVDGGDSFDAEYEEVEE